nr:heat shock 70 kDa protein 17 [Ipomoea batatas]
MRSSNSTANNSSTADLGGGTRVPKLQAKLQEFLGRKELDKHLDANETTVLGASLHAANISDGIKLNRKLGMIDGSMYGFVINVRINAFQKCVHCIYEERISEMRSLYFFGGRSAAGTGFFNAFEKCVPHIIRGTHFASEGSVKMEIMQQQQQHSSAEEIESWDDNKEKKWCSICKTTKTLRRHCGGTAYRSDTSIPGCSARAKIYI